MLKFILIFIWLIMVIASIFLKEIFTKFAEENSGQSTEKVQEVNHQNNKQPVEVDGFSEENCKKVSYTYKRFVDEVANSLAIPPTSIRIIGPSWVYGDYGCRIIISTPMGNKKCSSGRLLSDDGGKTVGAGGHGLGVNASCIPLN